MVTGEAGSESTATDATPTADAVAPESTAADASSSQETPKDGAPAKPSVMAAPMSGGATSLCPSALLSIVFVSFVLLQCL